MTRQLLLNISLTPIINKDNKTGNYIIYYNEFPQAIASGSTQDEAEINLGYLVEDMWKKRSSDLKKFLLEHHADSILIKSKPIVDPKRPI